MLPAARFRSVVLLAPFACHPGFDRRRSNLPAASVKIGGAAVAAPTVRPGLGSLCIPRR
jgi:hypothetical protein